MRFAVAILALGLMTGAPVLAPTGLMNKAEAQFTETLPSAEKATFDAAVAAIFADTTLTADQKRDRLATLVQNSSNPTAAARVLVASAANQSVDLQQAAGAALSQVSSNLQSTDPVAAANIVTVVATSPAVEIQIGYATYAPSAPTFAPTTTPTRTITPVVRRTPPRPPTPVTPIIPIVLEPNPQQAGSPT